MSSGGARPRTLISWPSSSEPDTTIRAPGRPAPAFRPPGVIDEREGVSVDDPPHLFEEREREPQVDPACFVQPPEMIPGKRELQAPEVVLELRGLRRAPRTGGR